MYWRDSGERVRCRWQRGGDIALRELAVSGLNHDCDTRQGGGQVK